MTTDTPIDWITANEIICDHPTIPPRLAAPIANQLKAFCLLRGYKAKRFGRTGEWMFDADHVEEWFEQEGDVFIATQIAKYQAQEATPQPPPAGVIDLAAHRRGGA